jgi:hypothetical protein
MSERRAPGLAGLGTVAIGAALAIVLLQAISSGTRDWPDLLAVVLAIAGVGLRIEAAVTR